MAFTVQLQFKMSVMTPMTNHLKVVYKNATMSKYHLILSQKIYA